MGRAAITSKEAKLYKIFGKNFRRLRMEKGYTQKKISTLLKVHLSMVQKVEHGSTTFSLYTIVRVCALLDCTFEDLTNRNK